MLAVHVPTAVSARAMVPSQPTRLCAFAASVFGSSCIAFFNGTGAEDQSAERVDLGGHWYL